MTFSQLHTEDPMFEFREESSPKNHKKETLFEYWIRIWRESLKEVLTND